MSGKTLLNYYGSCSPPLVKSIRGKGLLSDDSTLSNINSNFHAFLKLQWCNSIRGGTVFCYCQFFGNNITTTLSCICDGLSAHKKLPIRREIKEVSLILKVKIWKEDWRRVTKNVKVFTKD